MYIGNVQRGVGGRLISRIMAQRSQLSGVFLMSTLYRFRQCVSPKENEYEYLLDNAFG